MAYKQAAEALQAKVKASLGDKFSIISGDMERVRSSDVLDHALKVGDAAPEFILPDAFGHEVSLKSLLAEGPLGIRARLSSMPRTWSSSSTLRVCK